MKDKLIIIGAGGHGKVASDVARNMGTYEEIYFLDDKAEESVLGIKVLGASNEYSKWIDEADFFVAIGDCSTRKKIMEELEKECATIATLVHPRAIIGSNVKIGKGTVIMAGVVINADTKIGKGVIANTSCSIDHDNTIGDYCHISVGSHLSGAVKVGNGTLIGAGATVINNLEICENSTVGAGAVVTKNINEPRIYIGIPAGKVG